MGVRRGLLDHLAERFLLTPVWTFRRRLPWGGAHGKVHALAEVRRVKAPSEAK